MPKSLKAISHKSDLANPCQQKIAGSTPSSLKKNIEQETYEHVKLYLNK